MLREDDPSRFDYLFEPLVDDDAADDDTVDDGRPAQGPPDTDRQRPGATRIALAAFIIATVAGAGGIIVLLLQRPEPADDLDTPIDRTPPTTAQPNAPTPSVLAPPPMVTPPAIPMPERTVYITPQPPPQPDAPTTGRDPGVPVTRAPISVQPEPRTPFPNENQGDSREQEEGGGMLGGLPGVGDLPGPL
ncbi:MAG: hypothetical protein ACRDU5_03990 [Mycobacterium sp.]